MKLSFFVLPGLSSWEACQEPCKSLRQRRIQKSLPLQSCFPLPLGHAAACLADQRAICIAGRNNTMDTTPP